MATTPFTVTVEKLMNNPRALLIVVVLCSLAATAAPAQTSTAPGTTNYLAPRAQTPPTTQSALASPTTTFGTIARTDATCINALDAHDLAAGLKLTGKEAAFKGTVTRLFEPRSGTIAILNFDAQYKTAMTAVLRKDAYAKFPALKSLIGKAVLVTGKITNYHDAPEIVLASPDQIKLVE
jgi:hypothetical protein